MTTYLISFNDEWVSEHTHEQLLNATTTVCSVVARDGDPVFTDGPFVETKEHLGGFTVIEAPDDATARYWAGRLAVALDWTQELHRFPAPFHTTPQPQSTGDE